MRGRVVTMVTGLALLTVSCSSTVAGSSVRVSETGTVSAAPTSTPVSAPGVAGSRVSPAPAGPTSTSNPRSASSDTGALGAGGQPTGPGADVIDTTLTVRSMPTRTLLPGSTPTRATSPAREFDGATLVDASAFKGTVTDAGFSSPSGNITCGIQDGTVVCQIDKFTYTPPAHDCGASGWGFNFKLEASGPAFLFCAGDVESGGPVLGYGQQIVVGEVHCVSREDGITCRNTASGDGFRLSEAAYTFFHTVGPGAPTISASAPVALVGKWSSHGAALDITPAGTGTLDYRVYKFCSQDPTPPCDLVKDNEIHSGGHIVFALLTSSGANVARGDITSSNDPNHTLGTAVTATVSGYNLTLNFWPGAPFCASNTPADKWNCGA